MRKLFIFSLLLIAISGINAQNRKLRANLLFGDGGFSSW